ncbi:MAG: AmmeMemoRadiSam system protein A [Thiohalomonadaceae bacterium]
MSSTELSAADRDTLLRVAAASIRHGFTHARPLPVKAEDYPEALRPLRATFVTLLDRRNELRGCIGGLQAQWPLVEDVARHAFAAAFEDPRFLPVRPEEFSGLTLSISILNPAVALPASSEAELVAALRPGADGLILREGARRSTFLPSVWEQLPDPHDFLAHLRMKAGLPPDYWSDTLRFERYTTESFGTALCS